MIAALTSASISEAEIVVSPMVASTGEAGSAAGVGEGATGAGVGVGDGLGPAGLDAPGRRGVCATATIITKTATRAAEKSLRKFIQASFCRERGGARLQSLVHWATITGPR